MGLQSRINYNEPIPTVILSNHQLLAQLQMKWHTVNND